ncbi:MAG: MBL fold metallo-hydrolase [Chloroflexi bacterium]|nr:MBL fold metallo-hydrolase [Chloroflexota bacterium]
MKIKYLGHASFLITSDKGTRIITDPYAARPDLRYSEIRESADIVTVSHDHTDHNNAAAVRGNPVVVRGTAKVKGIDFKGIPTYHDEVKGEQRGKNTIICFEVDGVRVCHLGDIGHKLSEAQVAELSKVDILLIPVGGFYTIDAKVASQVSDAVAPKVIIPMHFKTSKCDFPIAKVDVFLQGKRNVSQLDASEAEFHKEKLPAATQIIVLKPAL